MKAVILHGTDGRPSHNWFPWIKSELESRGFEVWIPKLPNNHTPNRKAYNDFLLNSDWDFTNNLVIGHSSGAVSVLNLLEDERCPSIDIGILVGAWSHMDETDLDREQFKDLFPGGGFNFPKIKAKCKKLVFLHGDDDSFCPLDQAKWLANQTNNDIIIIPGGQHLVTTHKQLPELLKVTEQEYGK